MTYSFVVPIYNDADLADAFCDAFARALQTYTGRSSLAGTVELIFVNDGSRDDAVPLLRAAADRYDFVRVVSLSRNFGQHVALSCGYREATGEFVGMLNVDMEDPPDQIPRLLDAIRAGDHDIVFGLRDKVRVPVFTRLTSRLFHWLLDRLTGFETHPNVATLRVMNRRFVEAYNSLSERSRYLPGLESWLGFRRTYVPIVHQARRSGRSSYTTYTRLLVAVDSVISFSDIPLKLAAVAGALIALVGLLLTFILIIQRLFFVEISPGYTSTISVAVFLGGVQILFVGLASLYIGRILKEVQRRPLYVVRDRYPAGRSDAGV